MNNKIRLLVIKFDAEIKLNEVKFFRGAVIHALENDNILFHNHIDDSFRYSYPLIQYKCIQRSAAMVCIGDGVEAIGEFFSNFHGHMLLGERKVEMRVSTLRPQLYTVQVWDNRFYYRLNRWLPLNSKNYAEYQKMESLADQITFLEKILVGNILSFTKGVGLYMDNTVECKISAIKRSYIIRNKTMKLMAFDIEFISNVSMPDYIGLGKNASINCGILTHRTRREEATAE